MAELVRSEIDAAAGIARVFLSRPERRNALSAGLVEALKDTRIETRAWHLAIVYLLENKFATQAQTLVADARRKETGARGLASTLTRRLEDVAFESFGADASGDTAVRVTIKAGDLDIAIG